MIKTLWRDEPRDYITIYLLQIRTVAEKMLSIIANIVLQEIEVKRKKILYSHTSVQAVEAGNNYKIQLNLFHGYTENRKRRRTIDRTALVLY